MSGRRQRTRLGAKARVSFAVDTATDWRDVSAGEGHTCALKADGSLWCWGLDDFGQLGTGDTLDRGTPSRIGSELWMTVSAGSEITCAIRDDGSLWCFGLDATGRMGVPLETSTVPAPICE